MCSKIPPSWSGSTIQCNKELGILLLGTQEDQFKKICAMLHDEGLDVQRSPLPDIETWDELLDKCPVDIVVAGDHPAGSQECVEFARYLIRRNPLIDVLLYDVGRIDETTKYDKSLYTKIWTQDGAEFAQRALSMINMGRSKWNDIIFLRGMVISQVVELESYINEVLAAYFGSNMSDKLGKQFTEFILENPTFLLEGRKKVLQRVLASTGRKDQWKSIGSKLSNLQSLRNKVAHCGVEPDEPNLIISMDKEYKYDRANMRKIIQDARQARLHLIDLAKDIRSTQNSMQN